MAAAAPAFGQSAAELARQHAIERVSERSAHRTGERHLRTHAIARPNRGLVSRRGVGHVNGKQRVTKLRTHGHLHGSRRDFKRKTFHGSAFGKGIHYSSGVCTVYGGATVCLKGGYSEIGHLRHTGVGRIHHGGLAYRGHDIRRRGVKYARHGNRYGFAFRANAYSANRAYSSRGDCAAPIRNYWSGRRSGGFHRGVRAGYNRGFGLGFQPAYRSNVYVSPRNKYTRYANRGGCR